VTQTAAGLTANYQAQRKRNNPCYFAETIGHIGTENEQKNKQTNANWARRCGNYNSHHFNIAVFWDNTVKWVG
jgi:hypothetical protein